VANQVNIQQGQLYAVTQGTYKGSNLVVIQPGSNNIKFLDLPDMIAREIPRSEVVDGIDNNILELLELLPVDIIEICTKQYEKSISNR